jgi:hypothetical protein
MIIMVGEVFLPRGPKKVLMDSITATTTSVKQESRGHNAMILMADFESGSGTFTIKIQGKMPGTVDTFIDHYDSAGNLMQMASITADKSQFFVGIPDDFKIVATEDSDGATISVAYELLTV